MAGQAVLGSSMSRNRFKSIALYATVGIGLLLVFVGLLFAVEQRRTQAETGAVLSALFSQGVLHDMDKWGAAGRTIEIVIQRSPDCCMCPGDESGFGRQSWFTAIDIAGEFALGRLVCTIITNNASQLLPEQCFFDGHQYRLASTKRDSGGFC